MRLVTRTRVVGAAVVCIAAIVATALAVTRDRPFDRAFDARVAQPAFPANGPVVLFDEGHLNTHTTTGGYKPLADLLRSDGYAVRVVQQQLTAQALEGASVLVLPLARGANDANDDAAYTESEAAAIARWVHGGGSLLLITDHWPYGAAVASLARHFDIDMGAGMVQDAAHHDQERGDSHLVFSQENGLLLDHPIVRGRTPAERIRRVLTFTGQSVKGPAAAGRAQGIAMEVGAGRVVVLGEAGMLRGQRDRNGNRVGMHVPGYDNRQLALNILHWLSRAL